MHQAEAGTLYSIICVVDLIVASIIINRLSVTYLQVEVFFI